MATVKFQTEIVNFCPVCGEEFTAAEPRPDAPNNIIKCGESEEDSGCGSKFAVRVQE